MVKKGFIAELKSIVRGNYVKDNALVSDVVDAIPSVIRGALRRDGVFKWNNLGKFYLDEVTSATGDSTSRRIRFEPSPNLEEYLQ